ncbi:MAG: pilus assembly protein PilM [Planctomycetota bacterium]
MSTEPTKSKLSFALDGAELLQRARALVQSGVTPLPMGLDVGRTDVRLMQVETPGMRVAVGAAGRRRLGSLASAPDGLLTGEACDAIKDLMRGGGFRGKQIVAAIPENICRIKTLRVPAGDDASVFNATVEQIESLFPDMDGVVELRCIAGGEVHQRLRVDQQKKVEPLCEVMALAAERTAVEAYVEQLHGLGLHVAGLDFEPVALFRGIERFFRRREDEREVHVLIDLGEVGTQLVIGQGRRLGFYKKLDIGDADLNRAAADKLGITLDEASALRRRVGDPNPERPVSEDVRRAVIDATRPTIEKLGNEIGLCLRYWSVTFRGHRPVRVCLTGRGAEQKPVHELLGTSLGVPVEAARPLQNVQCDRMRHLERHDHFGEWAVALGLALSKAGGPFHGMVGPTRLEQAEAARIADEAEAREADNQLSLPEGAMQFREAA